MPNIVAAIEEMAAGRVDAIALTSSGQVRRLVDTARAKGLEAQLRKALGRDTGCVGRPGRLRRVEAFGYKTDIAPDNDAFFMRPLISAIAARLGGAPPKVRRRGMKLKLTRMGPCPCGRAGSACNASPARLRKLLI